MHIGTARAKDCPPKIWWKDVGVPLASAIQHAHRQFRREGVAACMLAAYMQFTPLMLAVASRDLAKVYELLHAGADPLEEVPLAIPSVEEQALVLPHDEAPLVHTVVSLATNQPEYRWSLEVSPAIVDLIESSRSWCDDTHHLFGPAFRRGVRHIFGLAVAMRSQPGRPRISREAWGLIVAKLPRWWGISAAATTADPSYIFTNVPIHQIERAVRSSCRGLPAIWELTTKAYTGYTAALASANLGARFKLALDDAQARQLAERAMQPPYAQIGLQGRWSLEVGIAFFVLTYGSVEIEHATRSRGLAQDELRDRLWLAREGLVSSFSGANSVSDRFRAGISDQCRDRLGGSQGTGQQPSLPSEPHTRTLSLQ